MSSETFILSLGRMSTSTNSSSAPGSWTSGSNVESDQDLASVFAHSEVSSALQRYLNKEALGKVAMTKSLCSERSDTRCLRTKKNQQKGLICGVSEHKVAGKI